MFFCPDCHVSNRSDAKFCRKCGKSRSDLERADVTVSVIEASTTIVSPVVVNSVGHHPSEPGSPLSQQDPSTQTANQSDLPAPNLVADEAPQLALEIEHGVSLNAPPSPNSPQCPSCWEALRATDKFCCWCGEPQPNRVLPFMKLCLECNTFLPEKANYCYSCGTDVGYSSRKKVRVPHELFKDEDSEFFPRFDA